jgi:uncharacterized membrane protein AbrB (regulator of aidB expression)
MINWIARQSIRKPMGWLAFSFILLVVCVYIKRDADIPPGIQNVVMALVTIPCAVIGSSSYEAVRNTREDDKHDSASENCD